MITRYSIHLAGLILLTLILMTGSPMVAQEPSPLAKATNLPPQGASSFDHSPSSATWEYYGTWNVFPPEYNTVAEIGCDTVFVHFYMWESTAAWDKKLATALARSLRVIVIVWPPPWTLNRAHYGDPNFTWDISAGTAIFGFLKAWDLAHPGHIVALAGLDEPYWWGPRNRGEECSTSDPQAGGYTTPELVSLRQLVRQQVALPVLHAITDLDYWEGKSIDPGSCYHGLTYADDAAYDMAAIFHYPFRVDQNGQPQYQRSEVARLLEANHQLKVNKHLQVQFVFFGQSFGDPPVPGAFRMPTASEMLDLGQLVLDAGVTAGLIWYPWRQDIYATTLASNPELWPAIAALAQPRPATATPTATSTQTRTPTTTTSPTVTPAPTRTASATPTSSATVTATASATPTRTARRLYLPMIIR